MTKISDSRARELTHWLDDMCADSSLPFQTMANYRDAAALIRQHNADAYTASSTSSDAENLRIASSS